MVAAAGGRPPRQQWQPRLRVELGWAISRRTLSKAAPKHTLPHGATHNLYLMQELVWCDCLQRVSVHHPL